VQRSTDEFDPCDESTHRVTAERKHMAVAKTNCRGEDSPRPRALMKVMVRHFAVFIPITLIGAACSTTPRPAPSLAQNREVDAFAAASAWPNAEIAVAIIAAQQFMAARHERDGYEYLKRLAREQPQRPILISLEGLLQARCAEEIPLLSRVAWV